MDIYHIVILNQSGKVIWSDDTEYYRTPSQNSTININATLPTGYNILVFKYDSKWQSGGFLYDMKLTINANNKSYSQKLCRPIETSHVPVCYNMGTSNIESWGGSYNHIDGVNYYSQSNDWYLSINKPNNTYYTNKAIYSNLDHTLKFYMPIMGYLWQADNLSNISNISNITFEGNTSFPAYVYLKNMSVFACNTFNEALAY